MGHVEVAGVSSQTYDLLQEQENQTTDYLLFFGVSAKKLSPWAILAAKKFGFVLAGVPLVLSVSFNITSLAHSR